MIRGAALVACIFGVLNLLLPSWNAVQRVQPGWQTAVILTATAFAFVLPLFYFALFRNEGTLAISPPLRSVAALAALALGLSMALEAVRLVGSRTPAASVSVRSRAAGPSAISPSHSGFSRRSR